MKEKIVSALGSYHACVPFVIGLAANMAFGVIGIYLAFYAAAGFLYGTLIGILNVAVVLCITTLALIVLNSVLYAICRPFRSVPIWPLEPTPAIIRTVIFACAFMAMSIISIYICLKS